MSSSSVSVLMPVQNGEKHVALAVESILTQTLNQFEMLVADDRSVDGTWTILEEFACHDSRIRVIRGDGRSLSALRNRLVQESKSELIVWMDADDVALPDRIRQQVEFMRENPDCDIAGSAVEVIDTDGQLIRTEQFPCEHQAIVDGMLAMSTKGLCFPSCIMRKSAFNRVGGFRDEYATVEDFDLFLRMSESGKLANMPATLLQYRWHPKSLSWTQPFRQADLALKSVNEFLSRQGLPLAPVGRRTVNTTVTLSQIHASWAVAAEDAGNHATAVKHAQRSLRINPANAKAWRTLSLAMFPLQYDEVYSPTRQKLHSIVRRLLNWCATVCDCGHRIVSGTADVLPRLLFRSGRQ